MEMACSSLQFSSQLHNASSRYRKLPTSPSPSPCCNLVLKSSNKNFSKTLFYRHTSIRACSQVGTAGSDPVLDKFSQFKDAFWRFLRPHTIRGTALGSLSLVTKALIENPNLIRVNKPYLPIAAGGLSVQSAWFLVLLFAVAGLLIVGMNFGPFITSLYCLGLFLASLGEDSQLNMTIRQVLNLNLVATYKLSTYCNGVNKPIFIAEELFIVKTIVSMACSPVAFITTFVTLFALAIAITKDLPDVEGDRKFQISTLAMKLGVRNIAFLGSGLLLTNYIGAVVAAIYMPQAFRSSLMIPVHVILALCLVFQAWLLERANYTKYYMGFFLFFTKETQILCGGSTAISCYRTSEGFWLAIFRPLKSLKTRKLLAISNVGKKQPQHTIDSCGIFSMQSTSSFLSSKYLITVFVP
ncbi:hypothetical protein RND71_021901 [Anisodus tanguticus]|uniref:Uncharacterized protein n=1 Tax=Anisodus tanguticus TaxID=243964 RepID=A0AAE1RZ15_9SOLA|nr:hypothetical protein RND71_021901 [Anisodus tanguticus]